MPLLRSLHTGQRIGPYELVQNLFEGPLATTWRARPIEGALTQRVALKTIPLAAIEDPEMEDAFLEETARARSVVHPGVARLLETGRETGFLFASFAWIEGQSLGSLLRAVPSASLPRDVALHLILQLADAVAAIHAAGLTHRAINPNNAFVSSDGVLHLLDLGVSTALAKSSSSTTFRHMVGKFSYLSPEQLWSRPITPRSDVFSLGLLSYELLVGHHPFRGQHERETTANILSPSPAPPPSQFNVSLPASLETLLLKALAKDPADRFQDASALHRALLEALTDRLAIASVEEVKAFFLPCLLPPDPSLSEPIHEPGPSPASPRPLLPPTKKLPLPLLVLACVGLVAVVGLFYKLRW